MLYHIVTYLKHHNKVIKYFVKVQFFLTNHYQEVFDKVLDLDKVHWYFLNQFVDVRDELLNSKN